MDDRYGVKACSCAVIRRTSRAPSPCSALKFVLDFGLIGLAFVGFYPVQNTIIFIFYFNFDTLLINHNQYLYIIFEVAMIKLILIVTDTSVLKNTYYFGQKNIYY